MYSEHCDSLFSSPCQTWSWPYKKWPKHVVYLLTPYTLIKSCCVLTYPPDISIWYLILFSRRLSLFGYCSTEKWQGPNLHNVVSCQFETPILLLSKKKKKKGRKLLFSSNDKSPYSLYLTFTTRRYLCPCYTLNNVTGNLSIRSQIWKTEQNLKCLRRINNTQQWK